MFVSIENFKVKVRDTRSAPPAISTGSEAELEAIENNSFQKTTFQESQNTRMPPSSCRQQKKMKRRVEVSDFKKLSGLGNLQGK